MAHRNHRQPDTYFLDSVDHVHKAIVLTDVRLKETKKDTFRLPEKQKEVILEALNESLEAEKNYKSNENASRTGSCISAGLAQGALTSNVSHNDETTAILAQGSANDDGKLAYQRQDNRLHEDVIAASTPIRGAPLTQEKRREIETQWHGLSSRHSNADV